MKKVLLVMFAFLCIAAVACTKSVRYSEDEIKNYPPNIQEQIRKGTVDLGMTSDQVRYAWGAPDSIKALEPYEGKSREEWIYTEQGTMGVIGTKILFFYEGKLLYIK
jgi:outer membrane protein assembly factor BamE (lipoprotein component of BamABCDE complex)